GTQDGQTPIHHQAPRGSRRSGAEPKKAESGFGEDRLPKAKSPYHDQGANDIGQDMQHGDPQRAGPSRSGGFDELPLLGPQHFSPGQSGKFSEERNSNGDDGIRQSGTEDGHHQDRQ